MDIQSLSDTTTPAQYALVPYGTELLRRLWPDIVVTAYDLADDAAILLAQAGRGGVKLIVGPDRSVLFAASVLDTDAALALFRAGRRTPLSDFIPDPAAS